MKLKLIVLGALLVLSGPLFAQQKASLTAANAACNANNCLTQVVDPSNGGATFTLTGPFSATVQFEASGDGGTTWVAVNATPSNSTTAASSATSAGVWQMNPAGYTNVRLRVSAFSSGPVVASIIFSIASARANGSGGGGGSVTGGSCTNQVATAIAATTAAPTCTTVTSAYVDTSIAQTGTDINTSNQVTATHLAAALPINQGGTATTAPAFAALTDGATVTWALSSALVANATLTFTTHGGSRTLNITGPVNGGNYVVWLKQDGTGGEGLTLGSGCTWKVSGGGSGAISPSTGASAIDVLAFTYDGTNCYANFNKNFN